MNYLVFDLETNTKEMYGRKANFKYNDIVAVGLCKNNEVYSEYVYPHKLDRFIIQEDILVGHNIKFDLLYLWHLDDLQDFFKRGGRIWDTQYAEYCLSGQQHKFPALRDIAVTKYGCKEREKRMEVYWDSTTTKVLNWSTKEILKIYPLNTQSVEIVTEFPEPSIDIIRGSIDTCHIPKELVLEDVQNDVLDTEKIYLQQIQKAKRLGIYDIIDIEMDAILATTEMEYNGIYTDKTILEINKKELQIELESERSKLFELVKGYWK